MDTHSQDAFTASEGRMLISAILGVFVFLCFFGWLAANWMMDCGEPGGQCVYATWAKGETRQ